MCLCLLLTVKFLCVRYHAQTRLLTDSRTTHAVSGRCLPPLPDLIKKKSQNNNTSGIWISLIHLPSHSLNLSSFSLRWPRRLSSVDTIT